MGRAGFGSRPWRAAWCCPIGTGQPILSRNSRMLFDQVFSFRTYHCFGSNESYGTHLPRPDVVCCSRARSPVHERRMNREDSTPKHGERLRQGRVPAGRPSGKRDSPGWTLTSNPSLVVTGQNFFMRTCFLPSLVAGLVARIAGFCAARQPRSHSVHHSNDLSSISIYANICHGSRHHQSA